MSKTPENHYLKREISVRGFKQKFIANKIDRHAEELTMWLKGTRQMPYEIEQKIREILGMSFEKPSKF